MTFENFLFSSKTLCVTSLFHFLVDVRYKPTRRKRIAPRTSSYSRSIAMTVVESIGEAGKRLTAFLVAYYEKRPVVAEGA